MIVLERKTGYNIVCCKPKPKKTDLKICRNNSSKAMNVKTNMGAKIPKCKAEMQKAEMPLFQRRVKQKKLFRELVDILPAVFNIV